MIELLTLLLIFTAVVFAYALGIVLYVIGYALLAIFIVAYIILIFAVPVLILTGMATVMKWIWNLL